MQGVPILVDTSSGVFRPLVPAAFRHPIFEAIHGLAHPGIRASRRLIANRFLWPGLASQVAAWCRDCQHCQRAKATATPPSPPLHIANPSQRFSHLHLDLVGPFPASAGGQTHLLTIIDRSTRWAEAIPLHVGGELRRRPDWRLDSTFRRPSTDHVRPRSTILFFALGRALPPPGG